MDTLAADLLKQVPPFTPNSDDVRKTGETEIFLDDPYGKEGDKKIDLGAMLVTIVNLYGKEYSRHFLQGVKKGSLAMELNFRDDDEIVLIESDIIFNKSHEEVVTLVQRLKVNVEIDFVTRRSQDETIYSDADEEVIVLEKDVYRDIRAEVDVDEQDGKIRAKATETELKEGEKYILRKPCGVEKVFMQVLKENGKALRCVNRRLKLSPDLRSADPSYNMELVKYRCCIFKGRKLPPTPCEPAVMIRHESSPRSRLYLRVRDDQISLQELDTDCLDGPEIINHSCAFYWKAGARVSRFERVQQTGCFLAVNKDETSVEVEKPKSPEEVKDNLNYRFYVNRKTDGECEGSS